jgi:hypothetical protein
MDTRARGKMHAVITTIQSPTESVRGLSVRLAGHGGLMLIVGDKKGPPSYDLPGTEFLSLASQLETPFALARLLPTGHYTRKNVGYLIAMARGASCIYETDDDNAPLPEWRPRDRDVPVRRVTQSGWVNVYRCFSSERVWPRGFPLDALVESFSRMPALGGAPESARAPIQQGLANRSPDVDAIWRLVLDSPFDFDDGPSVLLPPGAWCPFNSQSTWWWPEAYPLLYLPSNCSFRMTDIWRGFVAQRCLWELGLGLVFHAPEVFQERNPHDLMRDFHDEIPGYLRNRELAKVLEGLSLMGGAGNVGRNLRTCYEALVAREFFPRAELDLLDAWLADCEPATSGEPAGR